MSFSIWGKELVTAAYTLESAKITAPVTLAVVSDLHACWYGQDQSRLLAAVRAEHPDAVLFTGDLFDDKRENDAPAALVKPLSREYSCYSVSGNHEARLAHPEEADGFLRSLGITTLEGEVKPVEIAGQVFLLGGITDPERFSGKRHTETLPAGWQSQYAVCRKAARPDFYSILLSHRPDLVEQYRDCGFDLVLSGHAHGGQVRIPHLLNGLYAPHQGLFPKYAGGRYELGATTLIVSRGLSKKVWPRPFNPPELVVLHLQPKASD